METTNWTDLHPYILKLEQKGRVTRTFRRLDPARQKAILDAILEEAAEKGPASLNIKEVARRAGASVGSLYQYFPDRDGLLDFAVELSVEYMRDLFRMSRPYLLSMPLGEALQAYLSVGVEWGKTEAGMVRFLGRAAYQGDPDLAERAVRPIAVEMRSLVRDLLAGAASRGEIRADVDLEAAARVVNALLIVTGDSQLLPYLNNYFQIDDEAVPPERIPPALVAMILKGLT